ncbi:hypothetical protein BFJ69_g16360 [Fusarium oxysporum]|uniref:BTB domain-containing protein n=1 Tax=Fusarium oxysporum TaxID=5507 RepID=A0A420MBG9_FUSOX|nr:hypothetical protein BFJ69_g16360 [Fusarium oxysporum]
MSTTRIQIDPDGDTLVILGVKQDPPLPDSPESPIEKHFLCSKKHLTLASRRAAKLFSSKFKEASREADGLYHWNFGGILDSEAFELVLKIIHGKTRGIPQDVELDLLAGVASIVDDLECYDALSFFSQKWLLEYGWTYTLPQSVNETLAQLILVSFVFGNAALFQSSTRIAIRCSSDALPTFELPIRADITRTLLQEMKAAKLYPPPERPFSSLTLDLVIKSLRDVQSPKYFSSVGDSPSGNHSGMWRFFHQPFSPPAFQSTPSPSFLALHSQARSQTNAAPRGASGGFFGGSTVPQSKTASGDASGPASGGIFGGSAGFGAASKSQTSDPFRAVVTNNEEQPQNLVRHHCCLKEFIDPILNKAEAKIKGLNLADFPHPYFRDDDTV